MASFGSLKQAIFDKEARKQQYQDHIRGLNAYDRHKKFVDDYVSYYGKQKSVPGKLPVKTDLDTLREGYRFIRTEEDDMNPSWEQRLVKRYYDKLFKENFMQNQRRIESSRGEYATRFMNLHLGHEICTKDQYCIADMSHYKTGTIGLRWRTEKEVISGKGQFVCGNKHCDRKDNLSSYEVNFSYIEAGENKQALVKLVACERCAGKLLHKKLKKKEQLRQKEIDRHREKRDRSESDEDTEIDHGRSKDRRIGNKGSSSATTKKMDDEENFNEFLEGLFP